MALPYRRDAQRLGDVKLASVAGAWIDWRLLPEVVEAATLFGLAFALFRARCVGAELVDAMKLPFAIGSARAIVFVWGLGVLDFNDVSARGGATRHWRAAAPGKFVQGHLTRNRVAHRSAGIPSPEPCAPFANPLTILKSARMRTSPGMTNQRA